MLIDYKYWGNIGMQSKLTDAEWKVMTVLWERSPRTMMEITNALKKETGWTKYTVMSFLKRMEEKGALHFEEGEKAKLYYPDWKQEEVSITRNRRFFKESILWKNRINAECNGAAESTVKTGNRRTAANIT